MVQMCKNSILSLPKCHLWMLNHSDHYKSCTVYYDTLPHICLERETKYIKKLNRKVLSDITKYTNVPANRGCSWWNKWCNLLSQPKVLLFFFFLHRHDYIICTPITKSYSVTKMHDSWLHDFSIHQKKYTWLHIPPCTLLRYKQKNQVCNMFH
jgi:hypothetical protein